LSVSCKTGTPCKTLKSGVSISAEAIIFPSKLEKYVLKSMSACLPHDQNITNFYEPHMAYTVPTTLIKIKLMIMHPALNL